MTSLLRRIVLASLPPTLREQLKRTVCDAGTWAFRVAIRAARRTGLLFVAKPENSILVVYLSSHFGDAVMLLPMLEAIHREAPEVALDVACACGADALFAAVPFVRHVYAAPVSSEPPVSLRASLHRRWRLLLWYRRDLRHVHPRLCLMPRWGDDLFASQFLAFVLGAPVRAGYISSVNPLQRPAPQRDRLLTLRITGGSGLHEPQRFIHAAQQAGLLEPSTSWRTDVVSETLRTVSSSVPWSTLRDRLHLPETQPLAVLAPAASMANKVWPRSGFRALALALNKRGFAVVVLSGKADRNVAKEVAASLKDEETYLVAGTTSIPESVTLLAHCALFVGNDSGPGHAAGALGIPTVTLFASDRDAPRDHPLSAARIRPMGPYVTTLHPRLQDGCRDACTRSDSHCIAGISTEEVLEAALAQYAYKIENSRPQPVEYADVHA